MIMYTKNNSKQKHKKLKQEHQTFRIVSSIFQDLFNK